MSLENAETVLKSEGINVRLVETRSKKGVDGNDRRVVRVRKEGDTVELTWALFKTDVNYKTNGPEVRS